MPHQLTKTYIDDEKSKANVHHGSSNTNSQKLFITSSAHKVNIGSGKQL
jgi:hypothetical protein